MFRLLPVLIAAAALLVPTNIARADTGVLVRAPRAGLTATAGVHTALEEAATPSPAPTGSPSPAPGLAPGVRSGAGVIVLVILVGSLFLLRSRLDRDRR